MVISRNRLKRPHLDLAAPDKRKWRERLEAHLNSINELYYKAIADEDEQERSHLELEREFLNTNIEALPVDLMHQLQIQRPTLVLSVGSFGEKTVQQLLRDTQFASETVSSTDTAPLEIWRFNTLESIDATVTPCGRLRQPSIKCRTHQSHSTLFALPIWMRSKPRSWPDR